MRKLIFTTVSVLSLGVGGAGLSLAADTSNMAPNAGSNMPAMSGTPSYSTTAMNSNAEIRQAQQQLQDQGFYRGRIDGIIGPETEQAIGQFQQKNGLSQTATLDQPTMDKLLGNSAGSQRASGPTVFHGAGATANPQPTVSGSNIPKQ